MLLSELLETELRLLGEDWLLRDDELLLGLDGED